MDILNLTPENTFPKKELPIYISKAYYANFAEPKVHTHDFIEIAYVCEGKGYHMYDGVTYPVSKGELYIINSRTAHCFYPTTRANTENLVVYNVCFLPEFISEINIHLPILIELTDILLYKSLYADEIIYTPDLKLTGSMRTEIEQLYEKIYLEFTSEGINYVEILRLSLCELLLKIHRFYKLNHPSADNSVSLYRHQLIPDCIEYLRNNYAQKITIEELSNNFFLSKSYLSSLFKKATGFGVVEYLQHIRIEKACELLSTTTLSITEIVAQVGYTDYRFFNKSFKKIVGVTAHEYRKNTYLSADLSVSCSAAPSPTDNSTPS